MDGAHGCCMGTITFGALSCPTSLLQKRVLYDSTLGGLARAISLHNSAQTSLVRVNTKARVSRHFDPGDGERGLEDARGEGVDTGSFVGVSVSGTPPKRACFPSWFPCNTKITPQPKCTCNHIFWCFPGQLGGFQRAALNSVLPQNVCPQRKTLSYFFHFGVSITILA